VVAATRAEAAVITCSASITRVCGENASYEGHGFSRAANATLVTRL
jgi:hypothetical protein